jgi:hypothetical protein
VLYTMSAMDLASAVTAILVLRPMLRRHHAGNGVEYGYAAGAVRASH